MKKAEFIIVFLLFSAELSGAQLLTGRVQIEGNAFFGQYQLQSIMKTKEKCAFSGSVLENDIENILELYEDNGFPYSRITPADFSVNDHTAVDFKLRIDEGPRVKAKEIYFEGLRFTNPKTLEREVRIKSGDYFSGAKIRSSIGKLERLSYIEKITQVRLESDVEPSSAFVIFDVVEKKPNSIGGILGYMPGGGRGGGYFTSRVDLILGNIFGSGRKAQINWGKKDPHSSELHFDYQETRFLGYPSSLCLGLNQAYYDSTYLEFGLTVKTKSEISDRITWGLGFGWEKVMPEVAGKKSLPNSRKYSLGVRTDLDTRDNLDDPHKGMYYEAEVVYCKKSNFATSEFVPDKATVHEIRYGVDWENFIPIFSGQGLAWAAHLRSMKSDEKSVPFVDQFKMGGSNTLRGYDEDEFRGTTVAWSNLEYRYSIGHQSRVFTFFDYGYFCKLFQNPQTGLDQKISDDKSSYGFGLRVDSRLCILGIDYAIGEEDKITNGKIHFGIVNRF